MKKFLKAEALAAVRKGDIQAGIEKYREFLALEPNSTDDDAWAALGGAYRRAGDIDQAIKCYRHADQLKRTTYALVNLVSLHAARNTPADHEALGRDLPEAIRLCRETIEHTDATFWSWYDLATLQLIQGPPAEAMKTLYHAVALTPPAAKENFRSVLNNLRFLHERNPAIAGLAEAIFVVSEKVAEVNPIPIAPAPSSAAAPSSSSVTFATPPKVAVAPAGDSFDYLQRRIEPQRKWHAAKARWNKQRFYTMEIATLVAGASIPVVNLWAIHDSYWAGVLSAILGGIVVIATAVGKLCKFQENWLQYRALVETLDREVEIYLNGVADYAKVEQADRDRLLVERMENLLAANTTKYVTAQRGEKAAPRAEAAAKH